MKHPKLLLSVLLIGNNIVNVLIAVLISNIMYDIFDNLFIGITTGIVSFLILMFGEVIPKHLAYVHNERWALNAAIFVRAIVILLWPIGWIVSQISQILTRMKDDPERYNSVSNDMMNILWYSANARMLEKVNIHRIQNMIAFSDIAVGAIMTHRTKIFSLNGKLTLKETIENLSTSGFSRIPVYDTEPEKIVGIVLLKDAIHAMLNGNENRVLQDISRAPIYVSESKNLDYLLTLFQQKGKMNIAIVVDEYGGVAGLVTQEDILEEIVGELHDEWDVVEDEKISRIGENTYSIKGDIPIAKFNQHFMMQMPRRKGRRTLAGYLISRTGTLPALYELVETEYGNFVVTEVHGATITTLKYIKKDVEI